MADLAGISGIRAEGVRPVAELKKDNYRAWSTKMKAQLKVMECWQLVSGIALQPAAIGPLGSAVVTTAVVAARRSWDRRNDQAAAVLITSITDDELHTVQAVDEDRVAIWRRLQESIERSSEAEAEITFMTSFDFSHKEAETANEMIERFKRIICLDQGVAVNENTKKRMLIGRPADRY